MLSKIAQNWPKIVVFGPFFAKKFQKNFKKYHLRKKCAGWRYRANLEGLEKRIDNPGKREGWGGMGIYEIQILPILGLEMGSKRSFWLFSASKWYDIVSKIEILAKIRIRNNVPAYSDGKSSIISIQFGLLLIDEISTKISHFEVFTGFCPHLDPCTPRAPLRGTPWPTRKPRVYDGGVRLGKTGKGKGERF